VIQAEAGFVPAFCCLRQAIIDTMDDTVTPSSSRYKTVM
jgi:hypothetical protein